MSVIPRPHSRFLEVECHDCGSKQVIFNRIASQVSCNTCGATLAIPTGGKSKVTAKITGVLE